LDTSRNSFISNLMKRAQEIGPKGALDPSEDLDDAVVLVSANILANSIPPKAILAVVKDPSHARSVGAFLCLIVASILMWIEKDGHRISKNEVLASTFLVLYQMHERDIVASLASEGMRRFQSISQEAMDNRVVQEYLNGINHNIHRYIMTGDDALAETFADLYTALLEEKNAKPA